MSNAYEQIKNTIINRIVRFGPANNMSEECIGLQLNKIRRKKVKYTIHDIKLKNLLPLRCEEKYLFKENELGIRTPIKIFLMI